MKPSSLAPHDLNDVDNADRLVDSADGSLAYVPESKLCLLPGAGTDWRFAPLPRRSFAAHWNASTCLRHARWPTFTNVMKRKGFEETPSNSARGWKRVWASCQCRRRMTKADTRMLERGSGGPGDLRALKIGDLYAAAGLDAATRKDRQRLRRALRELDGDRHANGLMPLCVWVGRTDRVLEMVRRMMVDLGYLGPNEPAGPVVARLRDLSKPLTWSV